MRPTHLQRAHLIILGALILPLLSLLITGCHGSTDNSQNPAATAQSSASSGGSGDAIRINFTEAATSVDARTKAPSHPEGFEFERGRDLDLPSKPTSGTRKQVAKPLSAAPQTPGIPFCTLATSLCSPFDGIAYDNGYPPDPNAAVGAGNIAEVVNGLMQVTDRRGALQCKAAVTLQAFLGNTADHLTDPHVQFDNVNQRFIFVVTVSPPVATSSEPAMWVATSETEDPCGNWFAYRLTFHGDPYAKGRLLDFPMLGQDTHAILISTRTCDTPNYTNCNYFTIYGLPKSIMYAGAHVEFDCFEVDSLTAPITNAGQPMIDSPTSFFLAAVPGTGYKLYRLTNSGGAGASLSKTTIPAPFSKPSRAVNQPNTTVTLNSSDGNITSSPYFDGTFIWFVHDGDDDDFPTVRYGKLETGNNTVATTWAFHSGSSDDFNPSLTVGITPSGETVYLNWAFTDQKAGTPTTPVFAFGDATKPLVTIAGAGTIYGPGSTASGVASCTSNPCRFGDFSSVSLDPSVNGCAFATQEYFGTDGQWKTRIAPIGRCESPVIANR
jgi:hypothetical protein